MSRETVIEAILRHKIIVILRGLDEKELLATVHAMYKGGIRLAEVTYNSCQNPADEVTAERIARLVREFPDMQIGAGTVLTVKQTELTAQAGGKFIISPDTNPDVIRRTRELGLVSIPGAFTPSECTLAQRSGADFVKLFPCGEMQPSYLKALTAPLSHIRFLAVGGITESNMTDYLKAGACGIGVSSGIADTKVIRSGNFDAVTALAEKYAAAANSL